MCEVSPHPQGLQGSHLNLSQTSAQLEATYFLLNNKAVNAAILAGTDAAGAGAGVVEALNCWEYEAETMEALAEFGD